MKKSLFAALLFASITTANATIFDAADFIPAGNYTAGAFTEILVSDPTGEGIEARFKHNIHEWINLQEELGIGDGHRKFRAGLNTIVNFIPDYENQIGATVVFGLLYLGRESYTALQVSATPMIHKHFIILGNVPINPYLGLPLSIELHSGSYITSMQLAVGAIWTLPRNHNYYIDSEVGFSLARSESYIALGLGRRFGDGNEK